MLQHIAFYRFVRISDMEVTLAALRAAADGLSGSVLVSEEGINGTLAGPSDLLDHFERQMNSHDVLAPHFAGMTFRRTDCRTPPFGRLKISRKRQLVEMGLPPVDASVQPEGSLLTPQQWREFIQRDDVVIIDNRNSFEYRLGRFGNAIDPGVANFRDFPQWIHAQLPEWKAQGKQIGMYCTGGIRCEKTAAWLATEGVHVAQLHGGILNYLQTFPGAGLSSGSADDSNATSLSRAVPDSASPSMDQADWQGECFVFDNRIALDSHLQETGRDPDTVYAGEADGEFRAQRAKRLQAAVKDGVAPSVVLCPPGAWDTLHAFLCERFPMVSPENWLKRLQAGDIADTAGNTFNVSSPYRAGIRILYYRSVQQEPAVPFEAKVLFANERFIIADKPHFLPVAPSGRYVTQTLLVRLRQQLQLVELMPAHRIDRETAGLVLLTTDARYRDAYQALFRRRKVRKVYEAVAPVNPQLQFPLQLEQRIEQAEHFMQMRVVAESAGSLSERGENDFNARVRIHILQSAGDRALYQLEPQTGVRHQLRVQMASLGLPICNDQIYPVLQPEAPVDSITATYEKPLQLLARELAFDDPVTGETFHFCSERSLQWAPG